MNQKQVIAVFKIVSEDDGFRLMIKTPVGWKDVGEKKKVKEELFDLI